MWVTSGGLKHQAAEAIAQFTGGTQDTRGVWSGGAPCIVIDGTPDKRMALYERALVEHPRYVIVGYDQVVDDYSMVVQLDQMYVVVDEVTVIKNPAAAITQAVRAAFGEAPFRFGLTGTPAENGRCDEVFQIMEWIDDSVFGRADLFDQTFCKRNAYGQVREYINLPLFNELLSECSISIDPDDPGVREYMPTMTRPLRVLVELDAEGAVVYERMSKDLRVDLAEAAKKVSGTFDLMKHYAGNSDQADAQGRIMSKISCIRMLCAHPGQLINSGEEYQASRVKQDELDWLKEEHERDHGRHKQEKCPAPPHAAGWPVVTKKYGAKVMRFPKPLPGSAYAAQLLDEGVLDGLDESPKLDEVCLDIREVLRGRCRCCRGVDRPQETSKLVVFSYHKMVLRILEQRFPGCSVRYDGDMSLKRRNENKRRFKQEPGVRLFLTSDAGGYGVDLPEANHLFNLDKPFTAGRVTQRNARVRRANLEFHDAVHVRDYLIDGSLELYYAELTEQKQRVATAMRTGRGTTKGAITMSVGTLGLFLSEHEV